MTALLAPNQLLLSEQDYRLPSTAVYACSIRMQLERRMPKGACAGLFQSTNSLVHQILLELPEWLVASAVQSLYLQGVCVSQDTAFCHHGWP